MLDPSTLSDVARSPSWIVRSRSLANFREPRQFENGVSFDDPHEALGDRQLAVDALALGRHNDMGRSPSKGVEPKRRPNRTPRRNDDQQKNGKCAHVPNATRVHRTLGKNPATRERVLQTPASTQCRI